MRARAGVLRPLLMAVAAAVAITAITAGCGERGSPARDQRWQRDIAYLARRLPQVHVDGLTGVGHAAWEAAAARLEARVPRLGNGQVLAGMARMVALLHDDETQLRLPGSTWYPLRAGWIGGHLYLLMVPAPDRPFLGGQLTAVDGHPIASVLAALGTTIGFDPADTGLHQDSEAVYLSTPDALAWTGAASSAASAAFTVRTTAGQTRVLRLAAQRPGTWLLRLLPPDLPGRAYWLSLLGLVAATRPLAFYALDRPAPATIPLPLYLTNGASPYWMRVLASQHAVYIKYNQCLSNDGFQRLAARALAILRRNPGYRLIIDLRDNGGGDSQPFQNVANQIAGDPAIDKPGRLIGLVDTQTDSSATLDAQILKQQLRSVLIGQAPGDPVNEFGNDSGRLRLPYFDVVVQYTTKVVNGEQARMAVPDIAVAPTLRQLLAGDDPVLAAALSYR